MKAYKILKTETDYKVALSRTIEIFDAEPGNPNFDELEMLLL
jgi:HTH-type transcriptional regulator/antitoxin HigA